ncbi:MAG: hypothetical protein ABIE22_00250 [archaeon]
MGYIGSKVVDGLLAIAFPGIWEEQAVREEIAYTPEQIARMKETMQRADDYLRVLGYLAERNPEAAVCLRQLVDFEASRPIFDSEDPTEKRRENLDIIYESLIEPTLRTMESKDE